MPRKAASGAIVLTSDAAEPDVDDITPRVVVRMSRPENAVLLKMFLERDVAAKSGEALSDICKEIIVSMRQAEGVQEKTKIKLSVESIRTYTYSLYRRNYSQPLTKNNGASVPYLRDADGNRLLNEDGRTSLDPAILDRLEGNTAESR